MSLNFPIPTSVGQKYTDQNGVVWAAESVPPAAVKWIREGAIASYVEEAPADNKQYTRENEDWSEITIPAAIDPIPSGTIMLFFQSVTPVGWTKISTLNDYMLRMVSGAAGGTGGSDSPILMNKVPTHSHSASSNTTGRHSHEPNNTSKNFVRAESTGTVNLSTETNAGYDTVPNINSVTSTTTSNDGDHDHTITVQNNSGNNWTPKYIDVMQCSRD